MIDFVVTPPIMKIALCVAMETSKNTISTWTFFEDFFSMKHDTFLILKLLIKFLKELVVGQGLFSAKSPCLDILSQILDVIQSDVALYSQVH